MAESYLIVNNNKYNLLEFFFLLSFSIELYISTRTLDGIKIPICKIILGFNEFMRLTRTDPYNLDVYRQQHLLASNAS